MATSEGDGTPRRTPPRNEEEEYGVTPVSTSTDATPLPASESSLDQAVLARQADAQGPANLRDLARTRRTIGKSLKNMHEEFTQLLTSTQQECDARIQSVVKLLEKDRETTRELIMIESQKREALEKQLTGLVESAGILPLLGDPASTSGPALVSGVVPSVLDELLSSRVGMVAEATRVGLDELSQEMNKAMEKLAETTRVELEELRAGTNATMDSLSEAVQQHESKLSDIESTIQGVNIMAQELSERVMQGKGSDQGGSDPWSDWDILDCPEFQGLKKSR